MSREALRVFLIAGALGCSTPALAATDKPYYRLESATLGSEIYTTEGTATPREGGKEFLVIRFLQPIANGQVLLVHSDDFSVAHDVGGETQTAECLGIDIGATKIGVSFRDTWRVGSYVINFSRISAAGVPDPVLTSVLFSPAAGDHTFDLKYGTNVIISGIKGQRGGEMGPNFRVATPTPPPPPPKRKRSRKRR